MTIVDTQSMSHHRNEKNGTLRKECTTADGDTLKNRTMDSNSDTLKTSVDDDLGAETGYVSDSSLNSRRGSPPAPPKQTIEQLDDRLIKPNRKTKSERDKRRSSRISLLESNNDSGSEQSTSSLEQNQPRYRKRANSKRQDNEIKENISYRKRANSKTSPQLNRIDSVGDSDAVKNEEIRKKISVVSTATLNMNSKDIYFGTWNPKERAVLDQVLNNIDLKPDQQKSFTDKLKRGNRDSKKVKDKIDDITEEEIKYPLNQYIAPKSDKRKSIFGLFKKIFTRNDRIDEIENEYNEDPLQDYMIAHHKKKKSIFRKNIFSKSTSANSNKKDEFVPRRRAQSSNDYARSVACVLENNKKTNLSKKRSGSTQSLKALFSRAKSVDNLHGAFDYFANNEQVFKRTPSMKNIDKFTSNENLHPVGSQKSLSHGFEPVCLTSKDLCYNDSMVYANVKIVTPSTASQRSLNVQPQGIPFYGSPSKEEYFRGYQSDYVPTSASACPTYNPHYHSDAEYYSLRSNQNYYPPPRRLVGYHHPPPPHLTNAPHGYCYSPHYSPHHQPSLPNNYLWPHYNNTPPQSHIAPGYATPGFGSPNCLTPDNLTPRRGYSSECESNQKQATQQLTNVPFHARRAIERSFSKSSAASYQSYNGYISESSYCDDDDVFYGYLPTNNNSPKLHRNFSRASQHSQMSTVL